MSDEEGLVKLVKLIEASDTRRKIYDTQTHLHEYKRKKNKVSKWAKYEEDRLVRLNLSPLRINTLPSNSFDEFDQLKELRISKHHSFTSLPDGIFDNLGNLESLYLDSNWIKSLPDRIFDNLRNLKILNLDSNMIKSLPDGIFDNLVKLEELTFSRNKILSLSTGLFDNLS